MCTTYNVFILLFSYCVGAIPTGYIIAYCYGIKNIRLHGSGNIGATNVARILGNHFFIPVFVCDALKAYLNLLLVSHITDDPVLTVGAATAHLIGNGWSIFLRFQGGKGVATSVGLNAALQPWTLPVLIVLWGAAFIFTHTVGVASSITILFFPLCSWACGYGWLALLFASFTMCWIVYRHQSNIKNAITKKG